MECLYDTNNKNAQIGYKFVKKFEIKSMYSFYNYYISNVISIFNTFLDTTKSTCNCWYLA